MLNEVSPPYFLWKDTKTIYIFVFNDITKWHKKNSPWLYNIIPLSGVVAQCISVPIIGNIVQSQLYKIRIILLGEQSIGILTAFYADMKQSSSICRVPKRQKKILDPNLS